MAVFAGWIIWLVVPVDWMVRGRFEVTKGWTQTQCTITQQNCTRACSCCYKGQCDAFTHELLSDDCHVLSNSTFARNAQGRIVTGTFGPSEVTSHVLEAPCGSCDSGTLTAEVELREMMTMAMGMTITAMGTSMMTMVVMTLEASAEVVFRQMTLAKAALRASSWNSLCGWATLSSSRRLSRPATNQTSLGMGCTVQYARTVQCLPVAPSVRAPRPRHKSVSRRT